MNKKYLDLYEKLIDFNICSNKKLQIKLEGEKEITLVSRAGSINKSLLKSLIKICESEGAQMIVHPHGTIGFFFSKEKND